MSELMTAFVTNVGVLADWGGDKELYDTALGYFTTGWDARERAHEEQITRLRAEIEGHKIIEASQEKRLDEARENVENLRGGMIFYMPIQAVEMANENPTSYLSRAAAWLKAHSK